MPFEAFFLDTPGGARFCIHNGPVGAAKGGVVCIPPFAEEMNRSRRMLALAANSLADAGFAVLRMDLAGCGDSAGDFVDATWDAWVDDALQGVAWLTKRCPGPIWLWGTRVGALIGAAAIGSGAPVDGFLMVMPIMSGEAALRQFLRIKVAATMSGERRASVDSMLQDLDAGRAVDVAGYMLSPALARGLGAARMSFADDLSARLVCLEIAQRDQSGAATVPGAVAGAWGGSGRQVEVRIVEGMPYWQSAEPVDVSPIIEAVVASVQER